MRAKRFFASYLQLMDIQGLWVRYLQHCAIAINIIHYNPKLIGLYNIIHISTIGLYNIVHISTFGLYNIIHISTFGLYNIIHISAIGLDPV